MAVEQTRDLPYTEALTDEAFGGAVDVYAPTAAESMPVLVLLHGGGSTKEDNARLGMALAEQGAVVFVPGRRSSVSPASHTNDHGRMMREAMESVHCAVRFARHHATSFGGDGERISLLGQSEAGFLGLLAAMLGDALPSFWDTVTEEHGGPGQQTACLARQGTSAAVASFIGWNGAYFAFSPESPFHSAELWPQVDPYRHLHANPDLRIHLLVGELDQTQPAWHVDKVRSFAEDLRRLGYAGRLAVIEGAGHAMPTEGPPWDRVLASIAEVVKSPPHGAP